MSILLMQHVQEQDSESASVMNINEALLQTSMQPSVGPFLWLDRHTLADGDPDEGGASRFEVSPR